MLGRHVDNRCVGRITGDIDGNNPQSAKWKVAGGADP